MKKIIYLAIFTIVLVSCAGQVQQSAAVPLASPAPTLTPFPTSPAVGLVYYGEFTISDRYVTLRDAPNINGKSMGNAAPGTTWAFDFPAHEERSGSVWFKVSGQNWWAALKYCNPDTGVCRYFSTWQE